MAQKYDIENFCDDAMQILKDNLSAKLTSINSEKNDGLTLAAIDSNAYFFQTLDADQVNYDPFLFCEVANIEDTTDISIVSYTRIAFDVLIAIVVADNGHDVNISRRLLRYGRALREVFEENFDSKNNGLKICVQSQVPIELALLNSSYLHKAIGVMLKVEMG